MMPDNSAEKSLLVSRSAARERVRDALRLYVGHRRRYSVKQLSNATGVSDGTINKAIAEVEHPDFRPLPLDALLAITAFLGVDFANEWMPLTGLGAFELPTEEPPKPRELLADLVEHTADVARAAQTAANGAFAPAEHPCLKVVGTSLIRDGQRLVGLAA